MLHEAGALGEAENCFRRLLSVEPGDTEALFHLGALLQRTGRNAEAAETFRRALEHAPDDPHLWLRRGVALIALGSKEALHEAEGCFARAVRLRPDFAEAHFNLGFVAAQQDRHEEAVRGYRTALELRPDSALTQASLLSEMQQLCDWSRFDELVAKRRSSALRGDEGEPPPAPFGLLSIPSTPAEQLACARAYSRRIAERAAVELEGRAPSGLVEAPRAAAGPRRRVGYLSADFHEHVTAHVMAEVFDLHDRTRFETIAYSYGPDDGSAVRSQLERAFDRFNDLRRVSNAEAAAAIRADGVEILVDLKGHTRDARTEILALRPAPVQASYLGYPATMGADFIDYIVTDRFALPPPDAVHYSEQPVYLPGSYYTRDRRRPVGQTPSRAALGLPQEGFVFCCFNQAYKILPVIFGVWMRLLQAVPGSVLWLLDNNPAATVNLRREAGARGVDPARLVFAPKVAPEEYLGRLRAADLFLDTLPYNAHTTANDALWVGVPVITCPAETLPSRVAGSQLSALGLPELIAKSMTAYETLALELAHTPAALSNVRAKLARQRESAPLFDTARFTRHLEMAYEKMWAAHVAGARPRPIEV